MAHYTAPATPGTYPFTVRLTNEAGNSIEADCLLYVQDTPDANIAILFNPVILSVEGKRSGSDVEWQKTYGGSGDDYVRS